MAEVTKNKGPFLISNVNGIKETYTQASTFTTGDTLTFTAAAAYGLSTILWAHVIKTGGNVTTSCSITGSVLTFQATNATCDVFAIGH